MLVAEIELVKTFVIIDHFNEKTSLSRLIVKDDDQEAILEYNKKEIGEGKK